MENTCHRICLTPTKNESWIIEPFARAARQWADRVIVADQGSTDGTPQLAQSIPGVVVVANESPVFDEAHRQALLLKHARQQDGKRVLIALDADEALSANLHESDEWERIQNAKPGTVLRFRWVNILPGFEKAWIPPGHTVFGFVDDGSQHNGKKIHSTRVPHPHGAPIIDLEEIVVLHFQYVLWERMVSKQRWYQVWETLNFPEKSPLQIFRQYNHMLGSWNDSEIHPIKPEWFESYFAKGIDYRKLKCEPVTWWDSEIVQLLIEHGEKRFSKTAIWDKGWTKTARKMGIEDRVFKDPRGPFEKWVHGWLAKTQNHRSRTDVRLGESILRRIGW